MEERDSFIHSNVTDAFVHSNIERLLQVWDRSSDDLDEEFYLVVEQLRHFATRTNSLDVIAETLVARLILEARELNDKCKCISRGYDVEPDGALTPSPQCAQIADLMVDTAIKMLAAGILKTQQIWFFHTLNTIVTNLHQHHFAVPFDEDDDDVDVFQMAAVCSVISGLTNFAWPIWLAHIGEMYDEIQARDIEA